MMIKDGYKDIRDIIKEESEKHGISYNELKSLWDHHVSYVGDVMQQDDVFAIFLPYLGTMCLNEKQVLREKKGKSRTKYVDFWEKFNTMIADDDYNVEGNAHKRKMAATKAAKYIVKNYETPYDGEKKLLKLKDAWTILEGKVNGKYEEKAS